ncbi:Peptidase_S28 domain-containing protein [Cephalotus follicularis]|uniref:Peptidase_S28 domain-containing protein n=1 Tax=Cephalotus follicularis TaxID=3775 RepID=A0A1Q3APK2_CEPFO|nr:Peptidase_S28 domain-containing protein [Cephalotus follicularis]
MRIVALGFIVLWVFHFSLLYSFSYARIIPRFPSSISTPEKLSLSSKNKFYKTKYFTQILDHFNFNPQSYQTFQQRYLINDTYWGGAMENAPIFLYTGNEGDIEWFAQNTGFMYDNAPHFKALLVFIEHRFYGKSIPFGGDKDVAYSNASTLGYLGSTQALADYATLIINLKDNLTATDSPVVLFGGSYGGMLAAWFRLKYPHIAIGALASSAPILNFENITSPYSFNNIITRDFRSVSKNCFQVIKGSWQQFEDTANQPGGPQLLQKSFKTCNNRTTGSSIVNWLSSAFIYGAMTDYPTASNFLMPLPAYPVKQMCKAIDDPMTGNDTFAKLYGAANVYYNNSGTATCFNPDDKSDPHGLGEWTWQERRSNTYQNTISRSISSVSSTTQSPTRAACTEMIMPTDGNDEESLFPASQWNYNDRASLCKRFFDIEPRPNWITTEFGGHDIERILKRFGSNIIFFNGLRDPWSGGGVLKNISKSIVAFVEEEGAHHVDLRFSTNEDPEWLRDVRQSEVKVIRRWISRYYYDLAHPSS